MSRDQPDDLGSLTPGLDGASGPAAVAAHDLTKRFGSREVVSAVTLRIGEGRVFGLLGPNGAGKTTTVRLLTGLLTPTAGAVELFGAAVDRTSADALRGRIGVQTETNLYEALSVRENLRTWGDLYGVPRNALPGRIEATLEMLELGERVSSTVGELSKGMRQKLAVGRALLHEPDLLFLDEPTAGLDPEAATDLLHHIRQLVRSRRTTVVICTHQLHGLESLCDDVGILVDGRLVTSGDVPGLLQERWPGRRCRIAVEGDPAEAARIVRDAVAVPVSVAEGQLTLTLPDDSAIPPVVAVLVGTGCRVRAVVPEEPTLQELYFATVEAGRAVA